MALIGVRLAGCFAAAASAALTTALFVRHDARRPVLGGLLAGAGQLGNLIEGRTTFGLGCAFGLGAMICVRARSSRRRCIAIAGLGFVATAGSPVVGLFLLVAATGLVLRNWAAAVAIGSGAVVALALTSGVFGNGGWESFGFSDFRDALLATLAVVVIVPRHLAGLRVAAVVAALTVIGAYLVHTPIGNNSTRLSYLFAVPVVAAFAEARRSTTLAAIALTAWPQQVTLSHAFVAGPSTRPSYYRGVESAIEGFGPVAGRIEVPETQQHWDSDYLAEDFLLARGWLRQSDLKLNGVFFGRSPSPSEYNHWLTSNSVEFVAVPDAPLTDAGTNETKTIGVSPRLRLVWRDKHWRLYQVTTFQPIVSAPGRLDAADASRLMIAAPAHRTVIIHTRWSRFYALHTAADGACISPLPDGSTLLTTGAGGEFTLTSSLLDDDGHC